MRLFRLDQGNSGGCIQADDPDVKMKGSKSTRYIAAIDDRVERIKHSAALNGLQ